MLTIYTALLSSSSRGLSLHGHSATLPPGVRDDLHDAHQAGLPCDEPLLQGLPLLALERACCCAHDVQRLRRLRELAEDEAGTDDWKMLLG